MKLGPYFTSCANFAKRLSEAGADGVVIFNRFYQPDFDLEEMEVVPNLVLSSPHELRLRLHWAAILYHQVETYIAITGGVHDSSDVLKCMMAGAHVAMMTSALLKYGIEHIGVVLAGMEALDGRTRVCLGEADAGQHEPGEHREPGGIPPRQLSQDAGLVHLARAGNCADDVLIRDYITGGTVMPITPRTRTNSRRTTAAVASRNFFRPSSASVRMWWRW